MYKIDYRIEEKNDLFNYYLIITSNKKSSENLLITLEKTEKMDDVHFKSLMEIIKTSILLYCRCVSEDLQNLIFNDDIIFPKECINKNFKMGDQILVVKDNCYNFDIGKIIGIKENDIFTVEFTYSDYSTDCDFNKKDLILSNSCILKETIILCNDKISTVQKIKMENNILLYGVEIWGEKEIVFYKREDIEILEIDETEKGTFIQITDRNYYNKFYGYILKKIEKVNKYVIDIGTSVILLNINDVLEIDIKLNRDKKISINDVISVCDNTSTMLYSGRYGIVRCDDGKEYHIDFGNVIHHYKHHRVKKINIIE